MPTEKKRNGLMVGLAVGVVVLLVVWVLVGGKGGNPDHPSISSADQYMQVLGEAEKLSKQHLMDLAAGDDLTEPDKQDLRKAAVLFDSLAAFNPGNIGPYLGAGKSYEALGNHEAAVKRLREGLATIGGIKGQTLVERALLDTATEAHYTLSVALFNLHQYDEALKEVSTAIAMLHTVSPIYTTQRASIYIELRQYTPAKRDLAVALRADPNFARARQLLGFLAHSESDDLKHTATQQLNAKQYKKVIETCTRALILDPKRVVFFDLRAASKLALGDRSGARADVERALAIDPSDVDALKVQSMLK